MVTESAVVVVLTLLIAYLYARSGKHGFAASVLPIAVLPSVCLLGHFLSNRLPTSILPASQWGILFVVVGMVAAGSLFGAVGHSIKRKSARRVYLLVCGGFTVFFAFAEIIAILGVA